VASVFVSRIDTLVDKLLEQTMKSNSNTEDLKGKAAVANCHLIFANYRQLFEQDRFLKLADKGLKRQRFLWASTSTKNPAYSDIKYVTELIAPLTIDTLPVPTIEAFLDHGQIKIALTQDISMAQVVMERLKENNIDINQICDKLLKDGISAFQNSFASLLKSIEQKAAIF
jgi:transaldolase